MGTLTRCALSIGAAAVLLAGCSTLPFDSAQGRLAQDDAQLPIAAPPSFRIVYSFRGGQDGAVPRAGLIALRGMLYGTTSGSDRSGTVFSVTTTGAHHVLHHFAGGSTDGADPVANLIAVQDALYGTTYVGGVEDGGTVFRISTTGDEVVLHDFGEPGDGLYPEASLLAINGVLYGTTYWGGLEYPCLDVGCGTVFSVGLKSRLERLLYEFRGSFHHIRDGQYPQSSLIVVNGIFYGTTLYGGSHQKGTIFEVNPATGTEHVAYSFVGRDDGGGPGSGLVELDGRLYGTTYGGGAHKAGTVFQFDPKSGSERIIHSFGAGSDGSLPASSLVVVNGTLYGTTEYGGGNERCFDNRVRVDCGTVFSVSPGGVERILHRFGASRGDGKEPVASMIYFKDALYSTTTAGGTYGKGTIFALRP